MKEYKVSASNEVVALAKRSGLERGAAKAKPPTRAAG
jgi:hypothetical protein